MKKSVAVKTEENNSITETESLLTHTLRRMSDPGIEILPIETVTCEDVERQIRAVTEPAHSTVSSSLWINGEITGCAHVRTSRKDRILKNHWLIYWRHEPVRHGDRNLEPRLRATRHTRATRRTHFSRITTTSECFKSWWWRRTTHCKTSSQMNLAVSAINNLPTILHRYVSQTKVLHTKVPNFRGSKDKFNEFEPLLPNHLQSNQHRITEQNKLNNFQSLLGDETIKVSWEMKPSSFGKHWGSTQRTPSEMYFSNSDASLLRKISKKSPNTNGPN